MFSSALMVGRPQVRCRFVAAVCCGLLSVMPAAAQAAIEKPRAPEAAAGTTPTRPAQDGKPAYQEALGDWQIACAGDGSERRCSLVRQLFDEKTGQRILALELQAKDDRLQGVAILPFGIALQRGLTVQVRDGDAGKASAFETCLPAGCLAPVVLDQTALGALEQSKVLHVLVGMTDGQTANFAVPVAGIGAARTRLAVLAKTKG